MYRLLDSKNWSRYEYFRHFYDEAPCAIFLCDELDVTSLCASCDKSGVSFYISMLYIVSYIVNSHDEFKMTAVDSPQYEYPMPAVWKHVNVTHNVFHPETETYTAAFTVFEREFKSFYKNCREDIEKARRLRDMSVPCGGNTFEASCVPWRHFTSVGVSCETYPLMPIVAWGKFREENGRALLPMSVQIHHASADGFHLARFLNEVETMSTELAEKLQ